MSGSGTIPELGTTEIKFVRTEWYIELKKITVFGFVFV